MPIAQAIMEVVQIYVCATTSPHGSHRREVRAPGRFEPNGGSPKQWDLAPLFRESHKDM
jgi:hypothetical protein